MACEASAFTRHQVFEFWPSDMLRLFQEAGMPRREPPAASPCDRPGAAADEDAPRITSPLRGAVYTLRISRPAAMDLRATCSGCAGRLFWFVNRGLLGETSSGESLTWSPPAAGRYTLRVVDAAGRSDAREVSVEFVP